jgi:TRAP-type uncharacterized transport system substrate-binding protein
VVVGVAFILTNKYSTYSMSTSNSQQELVSMEDCLKEFQVFKEGIYNLQQDSSYVGIATGPTGGSYYRFGKDLEDLLTKHGIRAFAFETAGGDQNLNFLQTSDKQNLAIIKQDQINSESRTQKNIFTILKLSREEIHIFANNNIKTVQQLRNKTIVLGPTGRGGRYTAIEFLRKSGIREYTDSKDYIDIGMCKVLTKQADAFIYVSGKPIGIFSYIDKIQKKYPKTVGNYGFVSVEPLPELLQNWEESTISQNDYAWVDKPISTIATRSLLVTKIPIESNSTYKQQKCKQILSIIDVLNLRHSDLQQDGLHPKWKEVNFNQLEQTKKRIELACK